MRAVAKTLVSETFTMRPWNARAARVPRLRAGDAGIWYNMTIQVDT